MYLYIRMLTFAHSMTLLFRTVLPDDTMPYSGIWLMTKKMIKVTLVHIIRCWKGTFVSGTCTSGMRGVKGFTRSRKRTGVVKVLAMLWELFVCIVDGS